MLIWEFYRYEIVEGEHDLWKGVSKPYRETIRAFLVYFQNQVNNLVVVSVFAFIIVMNLCFGFSKQSVVVEEINKKENNSTVSSSSFLDGKLYVLTEVLSSPIQY